MADLATSVTRDDIRRLLVGRPPDVLDALETAGLVDGIVAGVASEVTSIVGPDPTGNLLTLSRWAVSHGAAAAVEMAVYPEQVENNDSRGPQLQSKFLGLLSQLRSLMAGDTTGGTGTPANVHPGTGGWSGTLSVQGP